MKISKKEFTMLAIVVLIGLIISTLLITSMANFHSALLTNAGHGFILLAFIFTYFNLGWTKYVVLLLSIIPYVVGISEAINIINKAPIGTSSYALASITPIVLPLIIITISFVKLYNFPHKAINNKIKDGK